ncbi:uncharacterized protein METZ01_LOCUS81551 [marine metagenome]|uniref:Uncharacterized protein n=1 Tax=marine metagenome TaxID=408172 RepID=A0A381UMY2_9ZZZZ
MLRDLETAGEVMAAIHQYLGFHNRNQAVRLTKCSIASESVCIGAVTSLARQGIGYRVNRPPLRETSPYFCIFGKPRAETVEPFGYLFVGSKCQLFGASVYLDAGHNPLFLENLDKRLATQGIVPQCFIEQNGPAYVFTKSRRRHQHRTVLAPHLLRAGYPQCIKTFLTRWRTLVHR